MPIKTVFNPLSGQFDEISQVALAAVGSVPNGNAASLAADQTITLQPADVNFPGVITTGTQSFAGIKTFTSPIVGSITGTSGNVTGVVALLNGGTGQTTKAAAFDALSPMTTLGDLIAGGVAGDGIRLAAGTQNQALITSAGIPTWSTLYQATYPNYIASNPNAEVNTSGWATYSNTASNIPVTGTGGSFAGTFARSGAQTLRGSASFLLAQPNSTNVQGQGVSYAFTIDNADLASVLNIAFDYNASSTFVAGNGTTPPLNDGTTSTNAGNSDIEVFVYDVTNSKLVYVTPQTITANGANNFKFSGNFQTSASSASYRLIFHVATASANATGWQFRFDNVNVKATSTAASTGAVVAFRNHATSNYSYTSGTLINLGPADFDTTSSYSAGLYTVPVSGFYLVSLADFFYTSGSNANFSVYKNGTYEIGLLQNSPAGSSGVGVGASALVKCIAGDVLTIVPDGTGVNFVSSTITPSVSIFLVGGASGSSGNGSVGPVVAAKYSKTAAGSTPANTPILYDTLFVDTVNAYNPATGLFTCPVAGNYQIECSQYIAASGVTVFIGKNGVTASGGQGYLVTGLASSIFQSGSMIVNCAAGDTLGVYTDTTANFNAGGNGTSQFSVFLIGGASGSSGTSVSALNGLTGPVTLAAGTNISLTPVGNTITIAATGGGSGITRSVNSVSTATTAGATAATDYVYLVSGTTTITLPTAVGNTNLYTIKRVGTNIVAIATTSAQTIDGSASASLTTQYTALSLVSDGANWNLV